MKRALIIGSSGGIGRAMCDTLDTRGVMVTGLSRRAGQIDVTDEGSVASAMRAVAGPFELVFIATGALGISGAVPEKSIRSLSTADMQAQFLLNAIGPALVMKHAIGVLPRNTRCVMAILSARVGSVGDNRLGGWYSYRAAKAALNQLIKCTAIELARSHKHAACVALHPGTVATEFTQKYVGRHPAVSPQQAANNLIRVIETLTPEQSGGFYDWSGAAVPW